MEDWASWLNESRRKPKESRQSGSGGVPELRTEIERDHDRILFSTPVRRLADKTQVFPLERNDSVRNRLTHSHEVSNLARSIGTQLVFDLSAAKIGATTKRIGEDVQDAQRNIPALLAAVGLAHDLGNPPFGHQGEAAIRSWYAEQDQSLKTLSAVQQNDFLRFEGNAQTFRLVTRLQIVDGNYGLDLTMATLAALMKYPTASDQIDDAHVATKKHGFFQSEKEIAEEVWRATKLGSKRRHPLTYIMEACDDIAYAVLDAEDAVKKGLVSFHDLVAYLEDHCDQDPVVTQLCKDAREKYTKYRTHQLSPAELNDVATQRLRVFAIGQMVRDTQNAFLGNQDQIYSGNLATGLLAISDSRKLRELLGQFDKQYAYANRSVRELELMGHNTIKNLMNFFWEAINEWKPKNKPIEAPLAAYVYSRISENYRRVFEDPKNPMPEAYRKFQLLGDMVSGMTDSFAVTLHRELKHHAQI